MGASNTWNSSTEIIFIRPTAKEIDLDKAYLWALSTDCYSSSSMHESAAKLLVLIDAIMPEALAGYSFWLEFLLSSLSLYAATQHAQISLILSGLPQLPPQSLGLS